MALGLHHGGSQIANPVMNLALSVKLTYKICRYPEERKLILSIPSSALSPGVSRTMFFLDGLFDAQRRGGSDS